LHRQLHVSPQQWAEIEPRLREFQAAVGPLCQQVDRSRSEVIGMIAAAEPDLEAIRAKQDEILATKRAIQSRVVDHLLAEKEILTAEQQARLFDLLRQRVGCAADPPMSGRGFGQGMGQVLRQQADQQGTAER
jgi:Spy/CpxP family protein refolding chaperone